MSETTELKYWLDHLPHSRIVIPRTLSLRDQLKYFLWRIYTPFHSLFRDIFLFLGLVKHEGRQNYLIGRIAPSEDIKSIATYLISQGYGNHFIAWKDKGELLSLRKLEDFKYQYHIRIFEDGQVRAHYEYTPECHPFLHLKAIGQEDRRSYFLELFSDRIVPHTS